MCGLLVTGAGGFVGSAVARRLVEWIAGGDARLWDGTAPAEVHAMLSPVASTTALEPIEGLRGWRVVRADMRDADDLAAMLRDCRPKAVLHLAFDPAGFADQSDADMHRDHLAPLAVLMEALARTPETRLVHTSTAWVLSPGDRLDEAAPVSPHLAYARTKLRLEAEVAALGRTTGVSWMTLRLFNVFGRYEGKTRLLPYLVDRLRRGAQAELTHGDQVRDFNDVDDVAEAYRLALTAPTKACGRLYHIGSGQGLSVRAFAEVVRERLGAQPALLRFGTASTLDHQITQLVCNPASAAVLLGWRPEPDMTPRIHAAIDWWLARPEAG